MKRLRSPWVSCACVLGALGVFGVLLSACDNSSPPASSSPVAPSSPQAGASPSADPGDFVTGILTSVPGLATPTLAPTPAGLTQADANNIYATVIDDVLGEKIPSVVYISPYVGQGDRLDDPNESQPIDQSLLSALTPESGTRYEMEDFSQAIGPLEDGGKVQDNGAFITLGEITSDPADPGGVITRGTIYRKVGDAEGNRFRLSRDSSKRTGWKVTDSTQEWNDSGS